MGGGGVYIKRGVQTFRTLWYLLFYQIWLATQLVAISILESSMSAVLIQNTLYKES